MDELTRPPWQEGAYSTRRHGLTLENCDAEPVQTPGCTQDWGTLLVLRPADLTILQVSESCASWLGAPPDQLLGRPVSTLLGEEGVARLRALLAAEELDRNPIYAFTLEAGAGGVPAALDLTIHVVDGFLIVELEPATARSGSDLFALVNRAAARLQVAGSLEDFSATAAEEVRRVTGLDRVMIYRFHRDHHGEVVAEHRRDDLPSWLGLHYPAEDIPRPAREIFLKIWVRPLPDAQGPLRELVPLVNPDSGRGLDMTHCALRGASVMYTEYLRNMGVAATLTMPIRVQGELWGLIACHHYTPLPSFPWTIRAASELLAQIISLQLKAVEAREHFAYRLRIDSIHQQLVAQAAQEGGLTSMLDGKPALLDGLDARGAALYHRDRWWRVGATPNDLQLDELAAWLEPRLEREPGNHSIFFTDSLSREWPEAAEFSAVASGILAFSPSRSRRAMMIWFRPETAQEIRWAGNPHDVPTVPGPRGARLSPRASFELFLESVRGRSRPWLPVEVEAADRLRLLMMELVVNRAEQLGALNVALTRSNEELDAFAYVASHDLKEPLRGIHKHAHLLLADAAVVDEENRRRLEALMRLTVRMDSLLDSLLHFSRVGRVQLETEDLDLGEVIAEALEMVGARATEGQTEVVIPRPLHPARGDRVRIREVFTNLLSNALKYNDRPVRRIEIGSLAPGEPGARPGMPADARGETIYFVRDNGIGIDRRHFDRVWGMFKRLHGRDAYGGGTGAGLTIVRKLIERHGGQIWIDSAPGEGTTFYFTLPGEDAARGAMNG